MRRFALLPVLVVAALAAPASAPGQDHELCRDTPANVKCQAGDGRQTPGGGEKVSHRAWPAITGVFWQVADSTGRAMTGGPDNDELLGHHGSDTLDGGPGRDTVRVRLNRAFRLRDCEIVNHFCAFGSDGHGGCRKPGQARASRRRF
jgi:hemolysin type calcium-binding protein